MTAQSEASCEAHDFWSAAKGIGLTSYYAPFDVPHRMTTMGHAVGAKGVLVPGATVKCSEDLTTQSTFLGHGLR